MALNQPLECGRSSLVAGGGGISSWFFSNLSLFDLSPKRKLLLLNQLPALDSFRDFSLSLPFSFSFVLPFRLETAVGVEGVRGERGGTGGTGGIVEESSGTASVGEEAEWRGDRVESVCIDRSDLSPREGVAVAGLEEARRIGANGPRLELGERGTAAPACANPFRCGEDELSAMSGLSLVSAEVEAIGGIVGGGIMATESSELTKSGSGRPGGKDGTVWLRCEGVRGCVSIT